MADSSDPVASPRPPPSAFLHTPDAIAYSKSPAIIHLKRDLLLPLALQPANPSSTAAPKKADRYRDGRDAHANSNGVLNTRFGDFPHSTLVGIPYGSQVRASSAGNNNNRKRKRSGEDGGSGFLHVLAPTAELWTTSLPHRTQVVYTPDSSYILNKLRVRPGSVLIEAGAGSGSFTHAGVRAVYRGYPDGREGVIEKGKKLGKVFSYEFHAERVGKLRDEINRHCLDGLVEIVHRDVCKDGFLVKRKKQKSERADGEGEGEKMDIDKKDGGESSTENSINESPEKMEDVSPEATAVFLDLPAPWLALPHLTRQVRPIPSLPTSTGPTPTPPPAPSTQSQQPSPPTPLHLRDSTTSPPPLLLSPLSLTHTIRLCTFSPCIEQVTRTVSVLRKLGWVEIEMLEISHHRLEVRCQTQKGYEDGAGPRSVQEAVERLRWVGRYRCEARREEEEEDEDTTTPGGEDEVEVAAAAPPAPAEAVAVGASSSNKRPAAATTTTTTKPSSFLRTHNHQPPPKIATRIEPEIKSHTSYLVFAVLPKSWSPLDEAAAAEYVAATTKGKTVGGAVVGEDRKGWQLAGERGSGSGSGGKESKRQVKKREREKREGKGLAAVAAAAVVVGVEKEKEKEKVI